MSSKIGPKERMMASESWGGFLPPGGLLPPLTLLNGWSLQLDVNIKYWRLAAGIIHLVGRIFFLPTKWMIPAARRRQRDSLPYTMNYTMEPNLLCISEHWTIMIQFSMIKIMIQFSMTWSNLALYVQVSHPLHGCETWTLKVSDTNKLQAFGMKCLSKWLNISCTITSAITKLLPVP